MSTNLVTYGEQEWLSSLSVNELCQVALENSWHHGSAWPSWMLPLSNQHHRQLYRQLLFRLGAAVRNLAAEEAFFALKPTLEVSVRQVWGTSGPIESGDEVVL